MRVVIGVLVFAALLLAACERSEQPYAAKKPSDGAPTYESVANEGATRTDIIVSSVLPQGEPVIDGKALFAANCSACHQLTGSGVPGVFPPLNKSPYVTSEKVDRMAAIVLYGLQGPIKVLGTEYNGVMAGLGGALKDEQIAAIMNYVRSAWDNTNSKGGTVTKETVAAVRKKYEAGKPGGFSISELGVEQ